MVWRKVKLDKKPAVKAKTARRGRPKGSKNKIKLGLETEISHWDSEPRTPSVDYVELCQKLQNALAKSYVECEDKDKDIRYFAKQVEVLEAQLWFKQRYIDTLELDLAHRKAAEDSMYESDDETVNEYLKKRRESNEDSTV